MRDQVTTKPQDNLRLNGSVKTPRADLMKRSSGHLNNKAAFQRGKISPTASRVAASSAAKVFPAAPAPAPAANRSITPAPYDTSAVDTTMKKTLNPFEKKVVDVPNRHRNTRQNPHLSQTVRNSTVFQAAPHPNVAPQRKTLLRNQLHSHAFEGSSNKTAGARRLKKVTTPRRCTKDGASEEIHYRKPHLVESKHRSTALPTSTAPLLASIVRTRTPQRTCLSRRSDDLQMNKTFSHHAGKKTDFSSTTVDSKGLERTKMRSIRTGGFLNQEHAFNGNPKVRSKTPTAGRMMYPDGRSVAARGHRSGTPTLDGAGRRIHTSNCRSHSVATFRHTPLV